VPDGSQRGLTATPLQLTRKKYSPRGRSSPVICCSHQHCTLTYLPRFADARIDRIDRPRPSAQCGIPGTQGAHAMHRDHDDDRQHPRKGWPVDNKNPGQFNSVELCLTTVAAASLAVDTETYRPATAPPDPARAHLLQAAKGIQAVTVFRPPDTSIIRGFIIVRFRTSAVPSCVEPDHHHGGSPLTCASRAPCPPGNIVIRSRH